MNNQETQDREPPMAHTRHEDPPGLRVSRDIPLPWLIGIVFALIVQAAMMYYQLNAVVDAQAKTTMEIEKLRATLGSKDLKDLEHDIKIADLQSRLSAIEVRLQGLKP
jgi:hypothetical protein